MHRFGHLIGKLGRAGVEVAGFGHAETDGGHFLGVKLGLGKTPNPADLRRFAGNIGTGKYETIAGKDHKLVLFSVRPENKRELTTLVKIVNAEHGLTPVKMAEIVKAKEKAEPEWVNEKYSFPSDLTPLDELRMSVRMLHLMGAAPGRVQYSSLNATLNGVHEGIAGVRTINGDHREALKVLARALRRIKTEIGPVATRTPDGHWEYNRETTIGQDLRYVETTLKMLREKGIK